MDIGHLPPRQRQRVERLRRELADWIGPRAEAPRLVRSPYRACPLGAHVDHQLGRVTGVALDRALLLAFVPARDRRVAVRSRQFPGTVEFSLDDAPPAPAGDWGDYARGAAHALGRGHRIERGLRALVDGHDDVGGLSSSAAVGVAYLLALECANGLDVGPAENVELDRVIENDYIGLSNGILDQSVILRAQAGELTHVDCLTGRARQVPVGAGRGVAVVVLFSGLRAPLMTTDYNRRVGECREAARRLLEAAAMPVPAPANLRAVPRDAFAAHGEGLPGPLRRRAAHFFGEQERVRRGVELWARGELEAFGELVTESGRSSVENYECGNDYLRSAWQALCAAPGVHGARFSGAGFRGCCIGLAEPEAAEAAAEDALARYRAMRPDVADAARAYVCRTAAGAGLLSGGGAV